MPIDNFYSALVKGVSEDELRRIFEDELAAAKKQMKEDKRKEVVENYRGYLIEDFIHYIEALVDDDISDNDYDRIYDKVEELLKPFEDLVLSLDIKNLSSEELERQIAELLNK